MVIEIIQNCQISDKSLNILLYHSPDLAQNSNRHTIDLQLSGHTHGGQIRLPLLGALFTGNLYGKILEAGRYLVNGMPSTSPADWVLKAPLLPEFDFCAVLK